MCSAPDWTGAIPSGFRTKPRFSCYAGSSASWEQQSEISLETLNNQMTALDIRIERRGRISSGRWAGQEILIKDDRESSGGYLILIGSDERGEQAGDIWVEADRLEDAFAQAGWTVEWEDPTASGPT